MSYIQTLFLSTALLAMTACGNKNAEAEAEQPSDTNATVEQTAINDDISLEISEQEKAAQETRTKLAAENLETGKKLLADNALKEETVVLPSGLQYEVLEKGPTSGSLPEEGDFLEIEYIWSHANGEVFADSAEQGGVVRVPFSEAIGKGVFEGASLMRPGDKYRFTIPPELAFGESGTSNGQIGPNETVVIELKIASLIDASANLATTETFMAENAKKKSVSTTESGLQYRPITEVNSDAPSPQPTDLVIVNYKGTLIDGTEFDSSYKTGKPAQFPVDRILPGLSEAVQLMQLGEKFEFVIPPSLAYGAGGTPNGPVTPNQAIIFEIELLQIKNPAANLAFGKKFLDDNATKEGVKTTASGLQYQVLEEGPTNGVNPKANSTVSVHYRGTLLDGTEFDSSYSRGTPTSFPVNGVIPGWTEALQLMRPGDKYKLFIPSELAYREAGSPPKIGPNETLIFEVELLEVQ